MTVSPRATYARNSSAARAPPSEVRWAHADAACLRRLPGRRLPLGSACCIFNAEGGVGGGRGGDSQPAQAGVGCSCADRAWLQRPVNVHGRGVGRRRGGRQRAAHGAGHGAKGAATSHGAPPLPHCAHRAGRGVGHGCGVQRRRDRLGRGGRRARSYFRFAPPLTRFIPYSLRESVPLFLKRQYDQTLGGLRRGAGGAAGGPPHAARLPQLAAVGVGLGHIAVSKKEAPIVRVTPV